MFISVFFLTKAILLVINKSNLRTTAQPNYLVFNIIEKSVSVKSAIRFIVWASHLLYAGLSFMDSNNSVVPLDSIFFIRTFFYKNMRLKKP